MMFLTAAAISTPIRSGLVYRRNRGADSSCCKNARSCSSGDATTSAVGSPRATSGANVGPEIAATFGLNRVLATSMTTSDIRINVSFSMPFAALTKNISAFRSGSVCENTCR